MDAQKTMLYVATEVIESYKELKKNIKSNNEVDLDMEMAKDRKLMIATKAIMTVNHIQNLEIKKQQLTLTQK